MSRMHEHIEFMQVPSYEYAVINTIKIGFI